MTLVLGAAFADSICMNVRSFRRDGTPVDTPLWVVTHSNHLYSYTDARSHKLKRMQRQPSVEIAACDVIGRRSTGWYRAHSQIIEDDAMRARVFELIRAKYGIHWYLSLWGSRLVDRIRHRVVLQFDPLDALPA